MQETIMSGLNTNQRVSKNFSISRHAGSGAVVAAFLGALWVLHYLATTQYGFSTAIFGGTGVVGFSLLEYTLGAAHNLDQFGNEAVFVVLTRFILVFGFSWLPSAALIALFDRFK
jgi:hypothetical protein